MPEGANNAPGRCRSVRIPNRPDIVEHTLHITLGAESPFFPYLKSPVNVRVSLKVPGEGGRGDIFDPPSVKGAGIQPEFPAVGGKHEKAAGVQEAQGPGSADPCGPAECQRMFPSVWNWRKWGDPGKSGHNSLCRRQSIRGSPPAPTGAPARGSGLEPGFFRPI